MTKRHRAHPVSYLVILMILAAPALGIVSSSGDARHNEPAVREIEFGDGDSMRQGLASGRIHSRSLASADVNEDGVADLISGYEEAGRGLVVVQMGDPDAIYPGEPTTRLRREVTPFRAGAKGLELPVPADFLVTGDFDNDGHMDILTAAARSSAVYLLPGKGQGEFGAPVKRSLSGVLTALSAGEGNKPDGLADFAVAVQRADGTSALELFESPLGAWKARPESYEVGAPVTGLALGDIDGDLFGELIASAGEDLIVVRGRDRRLSLGAEARDAARPVHVDRYSLGFKPVSIALSTPKAGQTRMLEAVDESGTLHQAPISPPWAFETAMPAASGDGTPYQGSTILPMRLDSDAVDDLVIADDSSPQPLSIINPSQLTTFTVTNTNDTGAGSLRAAIQSANGTPGADMISFGIPGPAPFVITPLSQLPDVTDPVTIDGTTQPGYAGSPIIEINGASAGAGSDGLPVSAGSSVVRGLVLRDFDGNGIRLRSNGGNRVERCFIGTDVTGSVARANHQNGIEIENSTLNTIGGTVPAARNVISANQVYGIEINPGPGNSSTFNSTDVPKPIADFTTTSSLVNSILTGPVIGVRVTVRILHTYDGDLRLTLVGPDGTHVDLSLNNGGSGDNYQNTVFDDQGGVLITAAAPPFASPPSYIPQSPLSAFNGGPSGGPWMLQVADTAAGDGGELQAWSIQIITAPSYSNQILGNYIGTDAGGSLSLGTQQVGVRIVNSPGNIVGTPAPGARNLISGHVIAGVQTHAAGAVKNTIQGNYIGPDRTGSNAISTGVGVNLHSDQNLVGGTAAGAGNLLSGHGVPNMPGTGIWITGDNNVVQGNFIGTNPAGTSSVPNAGIGVVVQQQLNTVGGGVPGAGNLISGNGNSGIQMFGDAKNNTVQGNLIGTNVTGTAALPNHGNGVETYDSETTLIGGPTPAERNVISGNDVNGIYLPMFQLHFFGGNRVFGNYIGTDITGTSAIGNGVHGVLLQSDSNVVGGPIGSGQGNLISGNLSDGIRVEDPAKLNSLVGNIIGLDKAANATLPNLGNGVGIRGMENTVGGFSSGEGNVISANRSAGVRITGTGQTRTTTYDSTDVPKSIPDLTTIASGITFSNSVLVADIDVKANIIHTFDGDLAISLVNNSGSRVLLSSRRGGSGDNLSNTVFDDEGTTPIAAGSAPFASPPAYRPDEQLAAYDGFQTGFSLFLEIRDLASGDVGTLNSWSLTVTTVLPTGGNNLIMGNTIGADVSGTQARGNQLAGILIENSAGNRIGDISQASSNLMSANQQGILITGATAIGNQVINSRIGTQADGVSPLGNLSEGALVTGGATSNRISDGSAFVANTIAFNGTSGVRLESGRCNSVVRNSIHSNGGLGIDLAPAGVNANDLGDTDLGPNDGQNYPEVTATPSGGNTQVVVNLNSLPNAKFELDLYSNDVPDPTGYGEGKKLISITYGAFTDSSGNLSWPILVPGSHKFVTVAVTDSCGNTSEFSEVVKTVLEASPAKDMLVERSGALLKVTYTPACGAGDHVIYWGMAGPFPIGPAGLNWLGGACGMGITGTAFFDPGQVEPGRVAYFLIAGQNGSVEGSYGQSSQGVEEPEATLPVVCDRAQYLGGICY